MKMQYSLRQYATVLSTYSQLMELSRLQCGSGLREILLMATSTSFTNPTRKVYASYIDDAINMNLYTTLLHSTIFTHLDNVGDLIDAFTPLHGGVPISPGTYKRLSAFMSSKSTGNSSLYFSKAAQALKSDFLIASGERTMDDRDNHIYFRSERPTGFYMINDVDTSPLLNTWLLYCKGMLNIPTPSPDFVKDKDTYLNIIDSALSIVQLMLNKINTSYREKAVMNNTAGIGPVDLTSIDQLNDLSISDATLLVVPYPKLEILWRIQEPETYGLSIRAERYISSFNSLPNIHTTSQLAG